MSLFSFLSSCSKSPPLSSSAAAGGPQPLRTAIGPSPWAFANRSATIGNVIYRFRNTAPENTKLVGMTSVQNADGATLLILDFQNYARILDDGSLLLWRQSDDTTNPRIVFDSVSLSSLQKISDPLATAAEIRAKNLGAGPLSGAQHWEYSGKFEAGTHAFTLPHDWSRFEETLVLGSCIPQKPSRAIFAFNWQKQQVEIFPQDWFNNGQYDFDYQWITRVARNSDGSITGDGIRLGQFQLDESNRQIKKWIKQDHFYMLQ